MKTSEIGTLERVPTTRLVPEGEDGFMYGEGVSEQALPTALLTAAFHVVELCLFFTPGKLTVSCLTSPRNA